eukprot:CAMPEP_0174239412 /NCGR_PEP_ID=MMETSP0417-20130205/14526_1 /TAXON_ID=242541 /ORGANISM="Mayorella sp, Strain BSH-02190019" /LENGTH=350 /DNA_ID=CAMNT_0015318349 /DNA_START=11 /DNA_END=1059 /DNA_ORIENTATION=+
MAERKSVNKYYPPDWRPEHGSVNKYHGQHPLRERARKLHLGILIIRFEMPFNVWCTGCGCHVGRGTRFNAEKKQAGSYFSTKIWEFSMKCRSCPNMMSIRTDPKNADYVCGDGCERKTETWDAKEFGTIDIVWNEEKSNDPLERLDHLVEDETKAKASHVLLSRLKTLQDSRSDTLSMNQLARDRFRIVKKQNAAEKEKNEARGIYLPLLPPSEQDRAAAQQVQFQSASKVTSADESAYRERLRLRSSSLFSPEHAIVKATATSTAVTLPLHPRAAASSSLGASTQRRRRSARRSTLSPSRSSSKGALTGVGGAMARRAADKKQRARDLLIANLKPGRHIAGGRARSTSV